MLRRIEGVVTDLTLHAVAAKEVSLGICQALIYLVWQPSRLEQTFAQHDAAIRRALVS